jgi:hypothetical protein
METRELKDEGLIVRCTIEEMTDEKLLEYSGIVVTQRRTKMAMLKAFHRKRYYERRFYGCTCKAKNVCQNCIALAGLIKEATEEHERLEIELASIIVPDLPAPKVEVIDLGALPF